MTTFQLFAISDFHQQPGFLIQPMTAQRVFEGPDGSRLTLTFDTQTGAIRITEN